MYELEIRESLSRRMSFLLALLLIAAVWPAALQAQTCAGTTPARHVPGPPPNHDPAAPDVDLWLPGVFRPGLTSRPNRRLPDDRDSTAWDSTDATGYSTGFEIFEGLDVAGDHLYVSYNIGFSIWDISGAFAERPKRIKVRDGWYFSDCQQDPRCGPFLSFPGSSELKFLVEDIVVLPEPGSDNVDVAVSGKNPVGISLWRFNTATEGLTAVYQDTSRVSRQVRLVSVDGDQGRTVYAFSSFSTGLAVYDVTRALAIGPCLQTIASDCPGVYLGTVGSISRGRYVDVMQRPSGEILVTVSDGDQVGQPLALQLWQVDDPSNPGAAILLFDGLDELIFGTSMFHYEGNDYLAVLERDDTLSLNVIKIFNITACSGGPCSLGAPVFDGLGVPPRVSPQFLTFSTYKGAPVLYHGFVGGPAGRKIEQLLDLRSLGRAGQNIVEVTDGGPTYFDALCRQDDLGYWAWYYPGNEFGLKNLSPRIGKFHPQTNYFYRAAGGVLDIHVWTPPEPVITTSVTDPDPAGLYWMGDEVTFEGSGSEGCNPVGAWTWTATTPPEISAVSTGETGNMVTYSFECDLAGRCDNAVVSVAGANSDPSCSGAMQIAAEITVKDPSVDLTSIEPSGGTFDQCNDVVFTAGLVGRGPIDLDWTVRRDPALDPDQDPQQTLNDTVGVEDLSTASPAFTWDTAAAVFAGIFIDGFESGSTSAWGQPAELTESFVIEAEVGGGSGPSVSVTVELNSCTP